MVGSVRCLCLAIFFAVILPLPAVAQQASPNKKFAIGGDSVGTTGILRADVDSSLDGPLLVSVKDAAGAPVVQAGGVNTLTLNLQRNRNTAKIQIALAAGVNQVTVKDSNNAAEFVTVNWSPGMEYSVPPIAPNTFAPSQVNPVRSDKLWAQADRIGNSPDWASVKVHIAPDLPGYNIDVTNSKNEVIDHRHYDLSRGGGSEFSSQVKLDPGTNTITVTAPGTAEQAVIAVPAMTAQLTAAEAADMEPPEYDWGRVRGYFSSGVIFSKERDDFSKTDIFLDFTLDKTYLAKPFPPFKNLNTFFDARLTSIPVTAAATPSASPSPTPSPTPACNTADCVAFITSRKAAMMQAGIYLPMYWNFTIWDRKVRVLGRSDRTETNALFIAPLAKGGILTTTGQQTAEAKQFGKDDVFNFFSYGIMIGHFRLHGTHTGSEFIPNPDIAPELISWLAITRGRWENFEVETPTGMKDAAGNDILWRQRPYRWEALGRLKIPETPFIIGFDGNFGKGPDDVRFLFGTRFDIGKILHTLKVASAQDTMGRTPATQ
jgi:hypothetical protein